MVAAENVKVNNRGTISKSAVAGGQEKKIEGKYEALIFSLCEWKNSKIDRISRGWLYNLKWLRKPRVDLWAEW